MDKEQIMHALEAFQEKHPNPQLRLDGYQHESWRNEPDLNNFKGFCSEPWVTGGKTGGNPWNEADRASNAEDPNDIDLLDDFLEEYYPNITVIQYKRLMRLVETQSWNQNEYYGNSSDYKCIYISFDNIAEYLSKIMNK